MNHVRAMAWKALVNGVPLLLVLVFIGRLDWAQAIALTIGLTFLAYVLGDLLILPLYGNTYGTLADGGLTLVVVWGLRAFGVPVSATAAVVAASVVMLIEALHYHRYLATTLTADE